MLKNLIFITGWWPPSFLLTKNKLLRNSPSSDFTCWIAPFLNISFISEFICNLSSRFTLANWGGPYWNGVWEKGIFWNPAQWTKYSHLELIFLNFLNKILVFLPVELASLWPGKNFWSKDVLLTCLHPEVVEYWGKMILLLLLCCLCVCGVDLTKNACDARPPSPLPCDGGGPPRKGGLFLLNVIGVDLVSLRRTSWYFCLVSNPLWSCARTTLYGSQRRC